MDHTQMFEKHIYSLFLNFETRKFIGSYEKSITVQYFSKCTIDVPDSLATIVWQELKSCLTNPTDFKQKIYTHTVDVNSQSIT